MKLLSFGLVVVFCSLSAEIRAASSPWIDIKAGSKQTKKSFSCVGKNFRFTITPEKGHVVIGDKEKYDLKDIRLRYIGGIDIDSNYASYYEAKNSVGQNVTAVLLKKKCKNKKKKDGFELYYRDPSYNDVMTACCSQNGI